MNQLTKIFGAAALVAISCYASAGQVAAPNNETQPLPIKGVLAAVKNGQVAFISDNGRFIFRGTVYDNWTQKEVKTLAEAKHANDYIEFKKLKFNVDELKPISIGNGPKEVTVFYDPYCPSCKDLMADSRKVEGYTFKYVAVPAMGEESIKAVRFAHCTDDKAKAEKVLLGQVKPSDIPNDKFEMCDTTAIAKRVVSSQLLGLKGVPFIVRDDGLVRAGYVKGELSNWLMADQ